MAVTLTLGGKSSTLGACIAKETKNTYWVLGGQPNNCKYGVQITAPAKDLPDEVELAGVKVTLKHQIRERDNKLQAVAHAIPVEVDGEKKAGKVVITDHGNGRWQVTAAVFGEGGSGGGSKVRDDLFA